MIRKYKNQSLWLVGEEELNDSCVCWCKILNSHKRTVLCLPQFFFLSGLFSLPSLFLGVLWCGIRKRSLRYKTEKMGGKRKGVLLLGLVPESP